LNAIAYGKVWCYRADPLRMTSTVAAGDQQHCKD
jgi:hypothetical protein